MPAPRRVRAPSALTIAGLDPSGGAGIAADLRAFEAAGVWGCAAVSVITVQSTRGLVECAPVDPHLVIEQAREVLSRQTVRAIKIGALGSEANVSAVARLVRRLGRSASRMIPVVLDPVLAASRSSPSRAPRSGARRSTNTRLLDGPAQGALRALASRVTLVTPNALEASVLLNRKVSTVAEAADAARELVKRGAHAALVKGGHLGGTESIDVLVVGHRTIELSVPRRRGTDIHGTGCILSSLIAGRLARRDPVHRTSELVFDRELIDAVRWAKRCLTHALDHAANVGEGAKVLSLEGLRDG